MTETTDFLVIGAGISGAATACRLARLGHRVLVLDRFAPAAMASGWTLAGVRQSGRHPAELPLAQAAVAIWGSLAEDLGAPTGYTREGNLRLARNAAEYEQIRAMVAEQRSLGLDLDFLPDAQSVRAVAPALSPEIHGASFCASDGHAEPTAAVAAFVAAAERAGAVFRNGERVVEILVEGDRVSGVRTERGDYAAPRVILAAGFHGAELLAPLGIEIPLSVRMVTVLRSMPAAPTLAQVLGVSGGGWAGRQELSGRFRVTSGGQPWHGEMSVVGGRPVVRPPMSSLLTTVAEMERLLPGTTSLPFEDSWAGLIDMTPDALPVLDTAPGVEGLVIGMGFSGHGFCLGPVTGDILSALALGQPPGFELSAFAARRFRANATGAAEAMTLHG